MKKFNCDFSSRFRILKGGKISLVVSALLGSVSLSFAAPSGGVVTSGGATISQSGNTTNIVQSTSKATINWQNFSIASNEIVNFNQPSVNSITLNRVIGNERSVIDGALNANGQVWILNSNGILFNSNAKINTAGLIATTKNITDADFNAGNYKFTGNSSESVVNMGTIEASDSGYVAMLANTVQNDGTIKAYKGTVHLTGASEATINLNGNSIVSLTVNKGVLDALVENKGAILADGGKIYLTTNAIDEILKGVVNNTGLIEANSLDDISGEVILFAHGGTANVSGTIEAKGGFVETSGKDLSVADGTIIKAKKWLIDPVNVVIESGGTVSAETINTYLAADRGTEDINQMEIQATGDITVNQAINILTDNVTAGGLTLIAGNDININNVITVGDSANLTLNHGWDGTTAWNGSNEGTIYGNGGSINMGMNGDKTAFVGKVNVGGFVYINEVEQTIIRDRAELAAISTDSTSLAGKYVLANDIDLSGEEWITLGTFRGTLNALGHTIDGMTIVVTNGVGDRGLFVGVEDGSVSNLVLTNIDISGNGNNYGTLASWMYNASISNIILEGSVTGAMDAHNGYFGGLTGWVGDTTIDNVHANVDVEGSRYVGGLVSYGENLTITNSSSKGIIKGGANYTGGLIGYHDQGTITNSYTTGSVEGNSYTGGLMGYNNGGTISGSYASGDVTNIGYYVGGLVGYNDADDSAALITDSYATGDVSGYWQVGGLVGFNWAEDVDAIISNSYATGAVSGDRYIGGLVGANENYGSGNAVIENSYATGAVSGIRRVGGLVGENAFWGTVGTHTGEVKILNSYATGTVDGDTYVGGLVGEAILSKIETSYATGKVTGAEELIGGLIGYSEGDDIENVFATGDVTNTSDASTITGALIGMSFGGSVTTSYASGLITVGENTIATLGGLIGFNDDGGTTVSDSFYNKTLNVGKSDEVTSGKTTDELRLFGTFADNNWDIAVDSTLTDIYPRFAANGSWIINPAATGSTGGLTPTPNPRPNPEPEPTQNTNIEKAITTIVNNTINNLNLPKDILLPKVNPVQNMPILPMTANVQSSPMMQNIAQRLGVEAGESVSLISSPLQSQQTQRVTLAEIIQIQASGNSETAQGTNVEVRETRVALGENSIVELVNGGVSLPEGVDQEFYVVKSSKRGNK
jgi:filamentous hemagglutinin family protein